MSTQFALIPQVRLHDSITNKLVAPVVKGFSAATIAELLEPLLGAFIKGHTHFMGYSYNSFSVQLILVSLLMYGVEALELFSEPVYANESEFAAFVRKESMRGLGVTAAEGAVVVGALGIPYRDFGLINAFVSTTGGNMVGDGIMDLAKRFLIVSSNPDYR